MKQIVAMHGWFGSSADWRNWHHLLTADGWLCKEGDRGYGLTKEYSPTWELDNSYICKNSVSQRTVISYSLGLHLLEESVLHNATHIILLSSFAEFLPPGHAGKALRAGLKGMATKLGSPGESKMLIRFLEKAAFPLPLSAMPPNPLLINGLTSQGRQRLQDDLEILSQCKDLPKGWPKHAKVLLINGEEDSIISSYTQESLLKKLDSQEVTSEEISGHGHALITQDVLHEVQLWLKLQP